MQRTWQPLIRQRNATAAGARRIRAGAKGRMRKIGSYLAVGTATLVWAAADPSDVTTGTQDQWDLVRNVDVSLGSPTQAVLFDDGSILVLDVSIGRVFHVGADDRALDVATAGDGPMEYRRASQIGLASRTLAFIYDEGLRRVLLVNASGRSVATISLREYIGSAARLGLFATRILGVSPDARQFVFVVSRVERARGRPPVLSDSSYVVRLSVIDSASPTIDTVATFRENAVAITLGAPGALIDPYAPIDGVAVAGPYTVIARGKDFLVEIMDSAKRRRALQLTYDRRRFTSDERKHYAESRGTLAGVPRRADIAGRGISQPTLADLPEAYPPFAAASTITSDARYVWLRTNEMTTRSVRYVVVDARTAAAERVEVPGSGVVLAAAGGRVLAVTIARSGDAKLVLYSRR
jgi:hypothetical protein